MIKGELLPASKLIHTQEEEERHDQFTFVYVVAYRAFSDLQVVDQEFSLDNVSGLAISSRKLNNKIPVTATRLRQFFKAVETMTNYHRV